MNHYSVPKPSMGKVVLCCALAVIVGFLFPLLLMLRLFFPVILPCISTMVAVALYASAGIVPAIAFCISAVVSAVVGFSPVIALAAIPVCAVPVAVTILGLKKGLPFFRQMRHAVIANIVGTVVSIAIAALIFGTNMIGSLMSEMQVIFEQMMPALWEVQGAMFESAGLSLSYEEFASAYFDSLKVLQHYYEMYLPGNLLTGASITAVLSVLWANWLLARRGEATVVSFVGLADWYLPSNMSIGMLMTLVVGLIINNMPISGAQTTWIAVSSLVQFAFVIQGFAAMDRRLRAAGSSRRRRTGMIVLVAILGMLSANGTILSLFFLIALAGVGSALFGRRGAVKLWMDKNKENNDGESR